MFCSLRVFTAHELSPFERSAWQQLPLHCSLLHCAHSNTAVLPSIARGTNGAVNKKLKSSQLNSAEFSC